MEKYRQKKKIVSVYRRLIWCERYFYFSEEGGRSRATNANIWNHTEVFTKNKNSPMILRWVVKIDLILTDLHIQGVYSYRAVFNSEAEQGGIQILVDGWGIFILLDG